MSLTGWVEALHYNAERFYQTIIITFLIVIFRIGGRLFFYKTKWEAGETLN